MVSRSTSPDGSGRVTSKLINQKVREQNIDKRSGTLALPSGSKEMKVSFGEKETLPTMTHQDIKVIKNSTFMSNNQTKLVLGAVRTVFGRKSVEANFQAALNEETYELEQFISVKYCGATSKHKKEESEVTKSLVYCHDLEGFTKHVLETRNLDPDSYIALIGIDEGQGSIKVRL